MLNIRVVFVGRRYDAAQSVPELLSLPEGATVDDALTAIQAGLDGRDAASDHGGNNHHLMRLGGEIAQLVPSMHRDPARRLHDQPSAHD